MKNWFLATICILLLLSIGFNVLAIRQKHSYTNEILNRYQSQLLGCAASFHESLTSEHKPDGPYFLLSSWQAASALELATLLGKHVPAYSLNNGVKVYSDLSLEMQLLITQSMNSQPSEDKLQRMDSILQEYANQLQHVDTANPEALREAHIKIHSEIRRKNLLHNDINLPQI